jgi:hypothetical protein
LSPGENAPAGGSLTSIGLRPPSVSLPPAQFEGVQEHAGVVAAVVDAVEARHVIFADHPLSKHAAAMRVELEVFT